MRKFQTALILLAVALLTLTAQPVLASVPQQAPVLENLPLPLALQLAATAEAPLCPARELSAQELVPAPELAAPRPIQLACDCYSCFAQCGQCGVKQCLAHPCDCNCLICAIP